MGRGRGRPPKIPGEALEVVRLSVSPETRAFYEKLAALFHTGEVTPALLMRTTLDSFRHDLESEAQNEWFKSLNDQLNGKVT